MPFYSDYVLTEPEWLLKPYILKNEVSGFVGAPKVGKDFLLADIGARLTRGWPMPPWSPTDPLAPSGDVPGYVIMITPEDKPTDTTGWRLQAAGADMSKVYDLTNIQRKQATGGMQRSKFGLPNDLGTLKHAIQAINSGVHPDTGKELPEPGPVLMVIMSPLSAIAMTTISFNQQLRHKIMEPLQDLAEECGVAIPIIHHFNKGVTKNSNLLDKINGSGGFAAALRCVSVIMRDEVNPDIRRVQSLATNLASGDEGDPLEYIIYGEHPDTHVRYRQPLPPANTDSYDQLEARVLAMLIDAERPVTSQELAAYTRLAHGIVRQMLQKAQQEGKVVKTRGAYTLAAIEPPQPATFPRPAPLVSWEE